MRLKFVIISMVILLFAGCIDKDTGIQIDKNVTDVGKDAKDLDNNATVKPVNTPTVIDVGSKEITEPTGNDTPTRDTPTRDSPTRDGSAQDGPTRDGPTRITGAETPIMSLKTANWCKVGESIEQKTGMTKLSFNIKGLAIYKGKDVCVAESSPEGIKFTYIFNEDKSYGTILITNPDGSISEEKY